MIRLRQLPRMSCIAALALAAGMSQPAWAYDFEIQAETIGQGASLRSFRLLGTDILFTERRITQTLSLSVWDIGGQSGSYRLYDRPSDRKPGGARLSLSSHMRIDHDFGSWASGGVVVDNRPHDAVDFIPELETRLLAMDVLYAYFSAEGLAGGAIDFHAGRLLEVGTMDWWSMDGVKARVNTPFHTAFEVVAGLRVRDSSPAGAANLEPDGTGSAECAEYVEGLIPGSGAWRPIDRLTPTMNDPFRNELDRCPQREVIMPTFGGAIETRGWSWLWARIDYRRSSSPTPGLIGPVDRFEHADTGLYPNELGQAPGWGVNEEHAGASARLDRRVAGDRVDLSPHAAVRYSLLHALVDEAHAGIRARMDGHTVEPEIYYSRPTFDGDSIFNVFSTEPYTDMRITYELRPATSPLGGFVRGWMRFFGSEPGAGADGEDAGGNTLAGGGQLGIRYGYGRDRFLRFDVFHEDGHGGRRTGSYVTGSWQLTRTTGMSGRLSVIDISTEIDSGPLGGRSTIVGAELGASYEVAPGVVFHAVAEDNISQERGNDLRLIGVVDLAFFPEV